MRRGMVMDTDLFLGVGERDNTNAWDAEVTI